MTTDRRHWLCVAYSFPPVNRSGTHRTSAFVRHLHRLGWDATVTSGPLEGEPIDENLLAHVPEPTRVVRTAWLDPLAAMRRAIHRPQGPSSPTLTRESPTSAPSALNPMKEWVTRLLKTPDSRSTWIAPTIVAGLQEIARRRPDILYSTSPYMSAHLVALVLSHVTRIPWVADFRDPWVDNPYRDLGFRSLARLDRTLESCVLHRAKKIICNTDTLRECVTERLPNLAHKCTAIANGIDIDLLQSTRPTRRGSPGDFVFLHCGQFYGPRRPHPLLAAVRHIARTAPDVAGKLRVILLGPTHYQDEPIQQLIGNYGVERWFTVAPPASHQETLSYMLGSDALILIGAGGPGSHLQVPNKLFEYLGAKKPIVAAVPAGSPAVDLLQAARAETIVCDPQDDRAIANAIVHGVTGHWPVVDNPWSGLHMLDRSRRASELAEIFDRLADRRIMSGPRIVRRATATIDRPGRRDWSAARDQSSFPAHVPTTPVCDREGS